jgi:hypothetical protein
MRWGADGPEEEVEEASADVGGSEPKPAYGGGFVVWYELYKRSGITDIGAGAAMGGIGCGNALCIKV